MKVSLLIFFAFLAGSVFSQELLLGKDQKYIFYKVISDSGLTVNTLMQRAKFYFTEKKNQDVKITLSSDSALEANDKVVIDKTILIASHPSGEVSYHFIFNAKPGRYRFWLTDFIYTPYSRDRYGNFVPKTGFGKPLETTPSPLKAAEWKAIMAATADKVKEFVAGFEKFMATKVTAPPKTKNSIEVLKTDW